MWKDGRYGFVVFVVLHVGTDGGGVLVAVGFVGCSGSVRGGSGEGIGASLTGVEVGVVLFVPAETEVRRRV